MVVGAGTLVCSLGDKKKKKKDVSKHERFRK